MMHRHRVGNAIFIYAFVLICFLTLSLTGLNALKPCVLEIRVSTGSALASPGTAETTATDDVVFEDPAYRASGGGHCGSYCG